MRYLLAMIMLVSLSVGAWSGRNQSLRDVPDQTWVDVCGFHGYYNPGEGGGAEVPWAYDANKKVFVRVGGCTNVYSNEVSFFDMGDTTWLFPWPYDINAPADRPGCGCNRGTCYDAINKRVWSLGGASSGCHGVYGLWRGDMTGRSWTSVRDVFAYQAHVACDTAAKKVVMNYSDLGTFKHTIVYDLQADSLRACAAMPGTGDADNVYYPVDSWYAMEYVPAMGGAMLVGHYHEDVGRGYQAKWVTWLFNTQTETWTDLQAGGLDFDYSRVILSYDPVAQVVLMMVSGEGLFVYTPNSNNTWEKLTTAIDPAAQAPASGENTWSEMFEYDSEHNVHVFVQLTTNRVFAFRYANSTASVQRMGGVGLARAQISCFPNPFNEITRVTYGVERSSGVRLSVFDMQGRLVRNLVNAPQAAGTYSILLAGNELKDGNSPVGNYVIRFEDGKKTFSRMAVFLK